MTPHFSSILLVKEISAEDGYLRITGRDGCGHIGFSDISKAASQLPRKDFRLDALYLALVRVPTNITRLLLIS